MLSTKLLLIVAVSLTATLTSGCSAPYVNLSGRWCIFANLTLSNDGLGRPVTWPVARSMCQSIGGDLVILDNQEKLTFVSKHVDARFPVEASYGYTYWIGAQENGRTWQWVNSQPVDLLSNIWLPDEPSVPATSSASPRYGKLVPADSIHGRKYLITANNNGVSPAHICETR